MPHKFIQLPSPTGSFHIGTTTYHLVDKKRKELHVDTSDNSYRELMVQVWYPAKAMSEKADYISFHVRNYIQESVKNATATSWQGAGYITQDVVTNSYRDAPIASNRKIYPVIVFSHGFGSINYVHTSLYEELASHGYIVVAPNHTYAADPVELSDGRIVGLADNFKTLQPGTQSFDEAMHQELDVWINDIIFILDELETINKYDAKNLLTDRLNLNAIGVAGHSFGGMAAYQLSSLDSRIKAGVNMDGALYGNFNRDIFIPFMFMYVEPEMLSTEELEKLHIQENDFAMFMQEMNTNVIKISASLKSKAYIVKFIQGNHMTFSDYFLMKPLLELTMLDPLRGIEITRALLLDFFDSYLRDEEIQVLNTVEVKYPEIIIKQK